MTSFDCRLKAIKACSACGNLHTSAFCCSKEKLKNKILVPMPESSQQHIKIERICFDCGDLLHGLNCLECDLTRKILEKAFQKFQNTSKSSNDNSNVVNAPREPFVVKQDPSVNSSQKSPLIDQQCCCECGDSLDGIFCQQCTCKSCGKGAHIGYNCPPKTPIISNPEPTKQTVDKIPQAQKSVQIPKIFGQCQKCGCNEYDGVCFYCKIRSETPNVLTPYSSNNTPDYSNPSPQPPTHSYENFGNNVHYGYDCSPQVPFIQSELCYNQDFNFSQNPQSLQQQFLCCNYCGGPHETFQCQPMNEDYYHEQNPCYDSNSFGFDQFQPPQYTVYHQILNSQNEFFNSQNEQFKSRCEHLNTQMTTLHDLIAQAMQKKEEEKRIAEEQAAKERYWKIPICDDDDDNDYTIAITPVLSTEEPVNSLIMENEHLDTISATESDEFIKSSVENLVPTPIEFEDFSDDECDLPPYDDSSKNHDFTFSNPLFDIDEDFTLSDESFSEEDIPKENFIIFSNPLFDLDEEIASTKVDRINDEVLEGIHSIPPGIDSFDAESDLVESVLNRDISIDSSPKIDSLSNEFAGELILPKSIPPEIEEVEFDPEGDILFLESLLYDNSSPRPPEALQANSNAIESLPPSHIPVADNDSLMEEIDLFLADDGSIPPGIESDDVDSVDDDTSISLPEFESFYVDYPNSGNSTIDVVEDIPVDVPNVLPTHPILEQDFIPTSEFFAYVVWIFLPFLAYPVIPPSLLSCGDEDTIFDPGISKVSFF
ncbi:hypothetical protein Tco_0138452 [Tanacetum coccineum]